MYLMEKSRHSFQLTPIECGSPNWLHKDDLQMVIILMEWETPKKSKIIIRGIGHTYHFV
jgi:hypothetical protein